MVSWIPTKRYSPIGVDVGQRSVKLLQFSADGTKLIESSRWEIPPQQSDASPEDHAAALVEALTQAREGRKFHGRDAVICLGARELFVQNIRVPRAEGPELTATVEQEAASRLPFPIAEAEVRYLSAADVRQGDVTKREVVLLACHRPVLEQTLNVVVAAGLRPVAVDVEPSALLRCYSKQYRRDEDVDQRVMFLHVGSSNCGVVIAQGDQVLFVKYIDVGGRHLDEAVSRHLKMSLADATALRRHNGDRRSDQQDPEVARSVREAIRPAIEQLAHELALCVRYHGVTFRGQPLARTVLCGGEANEPLAEALGQRLDVKCELGDPLRTYNSVEGLGRRGQWDIATGLALRNVDA